MTSLVETARSLWGLQDAQITLAARRENTVYRVDHAGKSFALRLHRPGYRSRTEILSELQWMAELSSAGLHVPTPIPAHDGQLVQRLDDTDVDLLTWLPGRPIGAGHVLDNIADPAALFHQLGTLMARVHNVTDAWVRPPGFTRPNWGRQGLLGNEPLWGNFWKHPHLNRDQTALLLKVRAKADAELAAIEGTLDFGLIHADMLTENVLLDGDTLALIDFDDAAFGFREFELVTALARFVDHPDYTKLRTALCDGYAVRRRVNSAHFDLFTLLRALTYLGWIADRLTEPGATKRSARSFELAMPLATKYLNRRT